MAQVLLVGIDPEAVDYTDPALPPGLDAAVIRRGIARGMDDLRAAGHGVEYLSIPADPAGLSGLSARLAQGGVDCVVVGGGVRLPPRNLVMFEAVLNAIAGASPAPRIALVARPDEAAASVARALALGKATGASDRS